MPQPKERDEDCFTPNHTHYGMLTNAADEVKKWVMKLNPPQYTKFCSSGYSLPAPQYFQGHPSIRMITNALEIYATEHVYNNAGSINRVVRIAPCYHRLVNLFTADPSQYKREIWYRPNLEPFDQNYNAKHAGKVERVPFADLVISNEPW